MHHTALQNDIQKTVAWALSEDLGGEINTNNDITASLIPSNNTSKATIISRDHAVICGTAWVNEVFSQLDPTTVITWHVKDGDTVKPNQLLCELAGNSRILLTGERTALNFLQTLSGTATLTQQYVKVLSNSNTQLLDTRKTLPGLRSAQKYAVTCGGGKNHRIGLFDAFLIKENHIAACGSIDNAIKTAKANFPNKIVEIEVENVDELVQAIKAQADIVMLDNFSPEQLPEAVALNEKFAAQFGKEKVKFEISGNMNITTLTNYAQIGIDFISVGALTKNVTAVDLSMRFVN